MDRLLSMAVFAKAVELGSFSAAAGVFRVSPQLVENTCKRLSSTSASAC
ncbi:hypothetical protein SAMN04515620_12629 [Collimonas sp. OK607]|nr:hypothetical protein SAMN04515620_12629 [Collimonas sp. OK607]